MIKKYNLIGFFIFLLLAAMGNQALAADCECDGGVTQLTLKYLGTDGATTYRVTDKDQKETIYSGSLDADGTFTINGFDGDKIENDFIVIIGGSTSSPIHTSCSKPIGIGASYGNVEVVAGVSEKGGNFCPNDGTQCGECDGGVTRLTLKYLGNDGATTYRVTDKDQKETIYSGSLDADGTFTINGFDGDKIENDFIVIIGGSTSSPVHTSCSKPIGVGSTYGNVEVVAGVSEKGGNFCPNDGTQCGECDGGVTRLTLKYLGNDGATTYRVTDKDQKETIYSGSLDADGTFTINGFDGDKIENDFIVIIGGSTSSPIHTSCSKPIGVGSTYGNVEVVAGVSEKGGNLCPIGGNGGGDCCDEGSKPIRVMMQLTGGTCGSSNNTQDDKFECFGGGNVNGPVDIVVSDDEDGDGHVYFSGRVDLNDTFIFFNNGDKFSSETFIIISRNGAVIQTINIHTSCSAPLVIGEVFGAATLLGIEYEDGGGICGSFDPPAKASLGDKVFLDSNDNGMQDIGEAGVPGVTVNLWSCGPGEKLQTTTTDADGMYLFEKLEAGNYQVQFEIPTFLTDYTFAKQNIGADETDSDADTDGLSDCVELEADENNRTVDAGILPPAPDKAALGDRVWVDKNNNGIQDNDEPGVPNVIVTLFTCDMQELNSTTTDANGNYLFEDLEAGSYKVVFSLPADFTFAKQDIGNDDSDSDADSNGATDCVELEAGETDRTVDAGIVPPQKVGAIGDKVWFDTDKDGVQDPGEPGVSGIKVVLLSCSPDGTTTQVDVQGTDQFGNYLFTDLAPGSYKVAFSAPNASAFTIQNIGDDMDDSDVNSIGETDCIKLDEGETNLSVDAGIVDEQQDSPASLGDKVWFDTDKDGVQDPGEPGVPNVTVRLFICSTEGILELQPTTTDANGNYLFTNLSPAEYRVVFENIPEGTSFTTRNVGNDMDDSDVDNFGRTECINLNSGETNLSVDAGIVDEVQNRPASLGDKVWQDDNENGVQDPTEPGVPGVRVVLFRCNPDGSFNWVATKTTNTEGEYLFSDLDADSYKVRFEKIPEGYSFTQANIGSDDSDSDADQTGRATCIDLASGETNLTIDAGLIPPTTTTDKVCLGDFIWKDDNGNGVQDAGENGIDNVKVILFTCDGAYQGLTYTDPSGKYEFCQLDPGSYKIKLENIPSGYAITRQDVGSDDTDSDIKPNAYSTCITVTEDTPTLDGGLIPPTTSDKFCLGDFVWMDSNANGAQDVGEAGVEGVKVILFTCGGSYLGRTYTGPNGEYEFCGLNAGSYKIKLENIPSGYSLTTKDATTDDLDSDIKPNAFSTCVDINGDDKTLDGGLIPSDPPGETSCIGDLVWKDLNGDGIQGSDEPGVQGVKIVLFTCDGSWKGTKYTDDNGKYEFCDLEAGRYKLKIENIPGGWTLTTLDAGSNDAIDSDAKSNKYTNCFDLPNGTNDKTRDFGLIEEGTSCPDGSASIGNRVWKDTDGDGIQISGENGADGIKLSLYTCNGSFIKSVYTDANGMFSFSDLEAGTYKVKIETVPTGYTLAPSNQGDNDASDSDCREDFYTDCITIAPCEINNTIDIGLITVCDFCAPVPVLDNSNTVYRINSGGTGIDQDDVIWSRDNDMGPFAFARGVSTATATALPKVDFTQIHNDLYQSAREGKEFGYDLPVVNGTYLVNFYFTSSAENADDSSFSSFLEGDNAFNRFNIRRSADQEGTIMKSYTVDVNDDELNILLRGETGNAIVSAIEVISMDGHQLPSLKIASEKVEELSLYPNPTSGQFAVQFSTGEFDHNAIISVYDQSMRLVMTREVNLNSGNQSTIDLSRYSSGMYIVKVATDTYPKQMGRLVKQ